MRNQICFISLFLAVLTLGCRTTTEPQSGTWQPIAQLPSGAYYHKIFFTNQQLGWVVGQSGQVLRTTDGGYNWLPVLTGSTTDFHSIVFVDDQTGWIAGQSNTIIRTTDGGNSWQSQSLASDTLHRFLALSFVDRQQGWVVSNYGEIFHTTNGGASWSAQLSVTQQGLNSVHFVSATRGWATTFDQTMVRTTDGGVNWEAIDLSTSLQVGWCTDLRFIDEQRGWIVTLVALSSSIQTSSPVLYTENGGTTWNQQTRLPSLMLNCIEVAYPSFAWVAGDNGIFSTQDGGTTWGSQYKNEGEVYVSLSFSDATHGWALSFSGNILRFGS